MPLLTETLGTGHQGNNVKREGDCLLRLRPSTPANLQLGFLGGRAIVIPFSDKTRHTIAVLWKDG